MIIDHVFHTCDDERVDKTKKVVPFRVVLLNREYSHGRNKASHVCRCTSATGGAVTGGWSAGTHISLVSTSSSSSNKSNRASSEIDEVNASDESKCVVCEGKVADEGNNDAPDVDGVADTHLGRAGPHTAAAAGRLEGGDCAGRRAETDGITTDTWARIDGPTCALDFNRRNWLSCARLSEPRTCTGGARNSGGGGPATARGGGGAGAAGGTAVRLGALTGAPLRLLMDCHSKSAML
jgi:hypothetical protein